MSPPAVVVALDPEKCLLPDVGEVVPWSGVDEFFFVGREERLGDRVIKAGGAAAHRAAHTIDSAEVSECFRGGWTPAVSVEYHGGWRVADEQRCGEVVDGQAGLEVVSDGVADHRVGV